MIHPVSCVVLLFIFASRAWILLTWWYLVFTWLLSQCCYSELSFTLEQRYWDTCSLFWDCKRRVHIQSIVVSWLSQLFFENPQSCHFNHGNILDLAAGPVHGLCCSVKAKLSTAGLCQHDSHCRDWCGIIKALPETKTLPSSRVNKVWACVVLGLYTEKKNLLKSYLKPPLESVSYQILQIGFFLVILYFLQTMQHHLEVKWERDFLWHMGKSWRDHPTSQLGPPEGFLSVKYCNTNVIRHFHTLKHYAISSFACRSCIFTCM